MCTLWNNNKQYKVEENGELSLPSVEETADQENEGDYDAVDDPFPLPYSISPAIYELELEADTATFTFRIPYGNSLYDFSLEGKLVVVMVKDNTLKQAL
jgi:hypothetical protein